MKRVIPFYTWMRKNVPLQVEQMFVNPGAYRTVARGGRMMESFVPEEDRLKPEEKNEFARDWTQMPWKTVGKSGKEEPVFWNPNMPYQGLK